MLERTREAVECSPVKIRNGYPYVIMPLIDGTGEITKDVMDEVIDRMVSIGNFDADLIVTVEAMGIPYATLLSMRTGIPFNIIRKRSYGLDGEISVVKNTGYENSIVYINGLKKGDRVLFVDDMISTGGTVKAIIDAIRKIGCEVVQILVVIDKGNNVEKISNDLDIPIKAVFGLDVIDGKPVFRETE